MEPVDALEQYAGHRWRDHDDAWYLHGITDVVERSTAVREDTFTDC